MGKEYAIILLGILGLCGSKVVLLGVMICQGLFGESNRRSILQVLRKRIENSCCCVCVRKDGDHVIPVTDNLYILHMQVI